MPDFEALARHQQSTRRLSSKRLKVVEKLPASVEYPTTDGKHFSTLFFGFSGGLIGSIIGTGLIFYLSAKELIDFKIIF